MNTETNAQTLTEKLKAQINALKTKEGRTALAARARNLTMAQKIGVGVSALLLLLLLVKLTSCIFGGNEKGPGGMSAATEISGKNGAEEGNQSSGEYSKEDSQEKSGKSPIEGLMGYKLGEVFNGKLDRSATEIIFGEDWFCVDNRAEFHEYSTMSKVLPRTKRICAIRVYSTQMGINFQTELATVETMLKNKYSGLELKQVSETSFGWKPKTGSCALLVGIIQHPLTPCVRIEVHNTALESLMAKEKNEILMEKAKKEADSVGDVF